MSPGISGKLRLNVKPVDLPAVIEARWRRLRPAGEGSRSSLMDSRAAQSPATPRGSSRWSGTCSATPSNSRPKAAACRCGSRGTGADVELGAERHGHRHQARVLPRGWATSPGRRQTARRHGGLGLGLAIVRTSSSFTAALSRRKVPVRARGVHRASRSPRRSRVAEDTGGFIGPGRPVRERRPRHRHHAAAPATIAGVRRGGGRRARRPGGAGPESAPGGRRRHHRVVDAGGHGGAAGRARIDVLLSDIGMPGEDGYALIRRVRAPRLRRRTNPGGALTAFAGGPRAGDLGRLQLHVPKPVEPTELATVVARLSAARGAPAPICPSMSTAYTQHSEPDERAGAPAGDRDAVRRAHRVPPAQAAGGRGDEARRSHPRREPASATARSATTSPSRTRARSPTRRASRPSCASSNSPRTCSPSNPPACTEAFTTCCSAGWPLEVVSRTTSPSSRSWAASPPVPFVRSSWARTPPWRATARPSTSRA